MKCLFRTLSGRLLLVFIIYLASQISPASIQASGYLATNTAAVTQLNLLEISYANAAGWIDNLAPEDHEDQILDWTVWGLAGLLELDVQTLRNNFYDQIPMRDPLFQDVAANRIGPGRSFRDDQGILHVLAPAGDPYAARAIGLVLDDYRKDAGEDASLTRLYWYQIDYENQKVILQPEEPKETAIIREEYGYLEMRVDTLAELQSFLSQTRHLSRLELRSGQLWAGGWNWPNTPSKQITVEDLTVLQRGYRSAVTSQASAADPYSVLDPKQRKAIEFLTELEETENEEKLVELFFSEFVIEELLSEEEAVGVVIALEAAQTDAELEQVLIDYADLVRKKIEDLLSDEQLQESLEDNDTIADFSTEPGFSLDPGQAMTAPELLDLLDPKQYPFLTENRELVDFTIAYAEAEDEEAVDLLYSDFVFEKLLNEEEMASVAKGLLSEDEEEFEAAYSKFVELILNRLYENLGVEFVHLLFDTAKGNPPYQVARYDGGLQGTEAGMTYFYTDIVAKGWGDEIGEGVPTGQVPGFISNLEAKTPWGHCTTEDESGRIWFGLREEAVSIRENRVDLGSLTTRIFTLITDPNGGEREIEPSYSFGRLVWWWDRHYIAMADYEPQYHRLDQLMRWSAAIAWLVNQNEILLPEAPANTIKNDWQFGDWLNEHPELKWRLDIPFVKPPGETTEALLVLYSKTYTNCGKEWINYGGISNAALKRMAEMLRLSATPGELGPVARTGINSLETVVNPTTGTGKIVNLSGTITRNIDDVIGNATKVDVVTEGRKVWSFGPFKANINETTPRRVSLGLSANPGVINQKIAIQGIEVGEISVQAGGTVATVTWQPGIVDRFRAMVHSVQEVLARPQVTLAEAATSARGSSMIYYTKDTNRAFLLLDDIGGNKRWVMIEKGSLPAVDTGDNFALRLGAPGNSDENFVSYTAQLLDDGSSTTGKSWVKLKNDNALLASHSTIVKIEQPMGQAEDLTSLIGQGVLSLEAARGPPVYLQSRLANQVLEEGLRIPAGGIGTGHQVKFVQVEITEDIAVLGKPDVLATGSSGEWIRPLGTAITAGTTIILVYLDDDCHVEQEQMQCEE